MLYEHYSGPRRVLCYGDSNTFGYDPIENSRYSEEQRYPTVLQTLLGKEWRVVEEGLPGRTAIFDDPTAEGMNGLQLITPILLTHAPLDTVTIMLGTNDSNSCYSSNARMIARGIVRLVKKALTTDCWHDAANPDILVICPTPITENYYRNYPRDPFDSGIDKRSAGIAAELQPLLAEIPHVRFMDAGKLPEVQCSEFDGLHLTGKAHVALARVLANELQKPV